MIHWSLIGLLALWVTTASAQTGVIEGRVKLPPREAELKATVQYPGQPGAVQPPPTTPLPAVVSVKGPFAGQTFAPPEKSPELVQKDAWFTPEVIAVLAGTTVEFPNLDNQYHNVFSYSKAKRFDLGRYPTGESRAVTFDQPGVVRIYCEIHAHMRAWVVVFENPYFTVTDETGRFRIENVPAGPRTVAAWQPMGRTVEKTVAVVAGQSVTVDFE